VQQPGGQHLRTVLNDAELKRASDCTLAVRHERTSTVQNGLRMHDAHEVGGSTPSTPTLLTSRFGSVAVSGTRLVQQPTIGPVCGPGCASPVHSGQRGSGRLLTLSGRGSGTGATLAPVPGLHVVRLIGVPMFVVNTR
jgi:hypothetical protein